MLRQIDPVRGFLISVGLDPEILVEFQYNPTRLTDRRSVNYTTLNAPALLLPVRQYSHGGDRTLSFTVHLDGLFKDRQGRLDNEARRTIRIELDDEGGITPELNKYRAFLYPRTNRWRRANQSRGSFVPLYSDTREFAGPPLCRFGFGENRIVDCIVTDIGITELLFNAQLAPVRADVAVTLVELMPYDDLGTSL